MPESKIPSTIKGYSVFPLELAPLPGLNLKEPAIHYLYLRSHEPKIPSPDDARTVFAVNVPIDATEAHFRSLFAHLAGCRVEKVEFESNGGPQQAMTAATQPLRQGKRSGDRKRKRDELDEDEAGGELPPVWDREIRRSGSSALIVFVDAQSAEMAMKYVKKKARRGGVVWGQGVEEKLPPLGSQRYINHHRLQYPSPAALQTSVDIYMTRYAEAEAQRVRAAARLRQEPDEDGFITVTRGGRTGPARQEDAQEAAEKQRKSREGLRDFYRFQTREERKREQHEMLRRFEEDRKKVGEMKRRRSGFKPE